MKPPTERLKLVTSFGELRAGMIVVVECKGCGGMHRGLLLSRGPGFCAKSVTFPMVPERVACGLLAEVCACAVTGRRAYRVLDGLEDDQTHTTTKKRAPREHAK